MRSLIAIVTVGALLAACSTDGGGSTTPAGGADAVTSDTPGTPSDTAGTGTPDTASPGPDIAQLPDTGPDTPDTGRAPLPDGLNGSPCTTSADCKCTKSPAECETDPEYLCLFGFCAEICQDATGGAIPTACTQISKASQWPSPWGCSDGLRICTPGPVTGMNISCGADAHCNANGLNGYSCVGPVLLSATQKVANGFCFPNHGKGKTGATCESGDACESNVCLSGTGDTGVCADLCKNDKQCPSGHRCLGLGITDPDTEVVGAWLGVCAAAPGSLKYCFSQADCAAGEVCEASVEPSSLKPQYHCLTSSTPGGAAVGEACSADADCFSGSCLFDGLTGGPDKGYCTNACQNKPEDCAAGMTCVGFPLHENATPDEPKDDPLTGLCTQTGSGDWCFQGLNWCTQPGETCVHADGMAEGLGQCAEDATCTPTCAATDPCGDDGCGGSCGTCTAPDTCTAGTCTCQPTCAATDPCGDDGCGGSCGTCTAPSTCTAGTCVAPAPKAAEIQAIVNTACAGCHTGGGASGGLASDDITTTWIGVPSIEAPALKRIEPGSTANSYIWHKINGTQSSVDGGGSKMPLGGSLTADQIATFKAWIEAGAPVN